MQSADILGLHHPFVVLCIIRNNAHAVDHTLTSELGTGNILGTLQINDFTVILQIIKFATPVRTDYQKIDIVFCNVIKLLPLIFLYNDLIRKTGLADIFDTLQKAVLYIQLATFDIIAFTGDTHNKVIPQLPGPFQNIVMSLVEQIKGTVSNDFFHYQFNPALSLLYFSKALPFPPAVL